MLSINSVKKCLSDTIEHRKRIDEPFGEFEQIFNELNIIYKIDEDSFEHLLNKTPTQDRIAPNKLRFDR